jgi:hypothetical protein
VNLGKLARQVKREAATNPKKAAVLGLMCLVAVWFWAPLVIDWVGPNEGSTAKTAKTVPAAAVANGVSLAAARPGKTPKDESPSPQPEHSWQKLVEWMERDPRTKPASLSDRVIDVDGPASALLNHLLNARSGTTVVRDPFHRPEPPWPMEEEAEANAEQQQLTAMPPERSPAELGAQLTSTIARADGSGVAMINGEVYRRGDTVALADADQSYDFQLTDVRPSGVTLVRDRKRYELRIPSPLEQAASGTTPPNADGPGGR